jgi:hypothetical protein
VIKVAVAVAKWVMEALTSKMAEMALNDGGSGSIDDGGGYYDAGDDCVEGGDCRDGGSSCVGWRWLC